MQLLIASPCQMVLTDKESGYGHSLIAVFHDFTIRIPESAEVPINALLPKEWAIFSKWRIEASEEGKVIKLLCEAFWPNGDVLFKTETIASEIMHNQTAFVIRNLGFPMGQDGLVKVVLSIFVADELAHEPVEIEINVRVQKDLHA